MATPHDDDAPSSPTLTITLAKCNPPPWARKEGAAPVAPPAHHPDCLPPEPCVCAGLEKRADDDWTDVQGVKVDTVTTADLDLVDRLDREATPGPWAQGNPARHVLLSPHGGIVMGQALFSEGKDADLALAALARTLLPRLARAYRALEVRLEAAQTWIKVHEAESKEIDQIRREWHENGERSGYARGRREAIEEAARYLRAYRDRTATSDIDPQDRALMVNTLDAAAEGVEAHETIARGGQS